MINFSRNNLDKATSPYLQQHKDNPIYWQEWSNEVLKYALLKEKVIFVSVGYATCHWCHVMAREAFSNKEIADFLNENFVCIKIDKEQRPDIDNYLMSFMQVTQGHGGWPLNVFLTSDIKPFSAMTYVPVNPNHGLDGFLNILHKIKEFYQLNKEKIPVFVLDAKSENYQDEEELVEHILRNFKSSGFGDGVQFPPHNTLLFLLSYYEEHRDARVKSVLLNLLNTIARKGLHDHLQGGFYRYCVDFEWNIPHFEKMLYDQAMLLWVYSAAVKVLKEESYKTVVEKLITCLQETFMGDNLFYSAHDADTNHIEGDPYVWEKKELKGFLTSEEMVKFESLFHMESNFEEKIHLIKKRLDVLPNIEKKLLLKRKLRPQPFIDRKYVTSWNALVGIGLLMASRYLENDVLKVKSTLLFKSLIKKHYHNGKLSHSSLDGKLQRGEFLEDYASVLLFATYLYEEDRTNLDLIKEIFNKVMEFKKDVWIGNKTEDFESVLASEFDHPTPSAVSLAEMAILRAKIILGEEYSSGKYKEGLNYDFFNWMNFVKKGNFHLIHVPNTILWKHLPFNCIQIGSKNIQDCYNRTCKEFKDVTELLRSIKKW